MREKGGYDDDIAKRRSGSRTDDDRSDDNDIGAGRTRIDIRRCSSGRSDDVVRHRFGRRRETRNES